MQDQEAVERAAEALWLRHNRNSMTNIPFEDLGEKTKQAYRGDVVLAVDTYLEATG